MIISLMEILDALLITVAIGFIFSDTIRQILFQARIMVKSYWHLLFYSAMIAAPGVLLHEMGHKFVALLTGVPAVFHASYWGLGIGAALKLAGFPFIFFIPGYVEHGQTAPLVGSLISFAGPFMNLVLWLAAFLLLKTKKAKKSRKYQVGLVLTKKINMFLFIFNMLPIPPFDGFWFFYGIFKAVF